MKLIIFSGLPGTGKSSLAEWLGEKLQIPVFAKDWLEAPLVQSGFSNKEKLGFAGYQLLTTLAERQLLLNQSVILDSVASFQRIRESWISLASKYQADWYAIEVVCSNIELHKQRLKTRKRNIPGWHELRWADVEKVKSYYETWDSPCLTLDSKNSLETNKKQLITYLQGN